MSTKMRITSERLSNGTEVFYKTHPFGGYDVHTDPSRPRIGYVYKSCSTWIASVEKKWDSGHCSARAEAVLKLWKHVFKGEKKDE